MCRGKGSVMTKSEVNIRCFASGDHSWGTADIYSAALQKGINISYTEKKSSSNLSSRAAALQNDPISPYGAEEGDKAFSRIQEADDKCEKHEEVLKSPKSVSGRLIFMESPPCTPRPKAKVLLVSLLIAATRKTTKVTQMMRASMSGSASGTWYCKNMS